MPYDLSLQKYTLPEFYREAPVTWETRLREISPVTDNLAHLRFRWREPQSFWLHPERGCWEIYSCTPRRIISRERAEQFDRHWSEMPQDQQLGRRTYVTSYQHFMWHVHGVEAKRFWVLQGEGGGTPAAYTRREERMLDAEGWLSEPFPLGTFPACPFDERTVNAILARDRFLQSGKNLDRLEQMDRPDYLKAEDDLAEKDFRRKWLGWWCEQMQPQAEFMKSYLRTSESDQTLRRASKAEANAMSDWRDRYIEHGSLSGAGPASSTKIAVAVPSSL